MKLTTQIYRIMVILQPLLLFAMVFKLISIIRFVSDFILIGSYLQLFSITISIGAKIKRSYIWAFIVMLIAFISLCFSGLSRDGFIAYLMFGSMISAWIVYPFIDDNVFNNAYKYSFILQALLLVYFSLQSFAYVLVEDGIVLTSESLTLGFNNPNLASIILFCVFDAILMYFNEEHRYFVKICLFLLLLLLFYFIILTDCRITLFMSIVLFVSFFLAYIKSFGLIMKKKIVTIAILVFPIIFCIMYLYLYDIPRFRDMEFLGKPLFSGREILYVDFFRTLSENPLIGLCGKYKFANAHNGMLTILLNTGYVGLFSYLIYIYKNLRVLSNRINTTSDVLPFIAIVAIFVNSSVESAMLVGGNLFYVYFMYLLLLTKRKAIL